MIAVSYLKSVYDKKETLKRIDESIGDFIHVDLMNGLYVENNNFEINEVLNDLKDLHKPLDIHLMVNNPEKYINILSTLKPDTISIHLNTTNNIMKVINQIKEKNIKVGIAIKPDEDIHLLDEFIDNIDYVLIMSVYPGKGGQVFIPSVLDKIEYLKNKNVLIGIDGGINNKTIKLLRNYAISRIVSGSFICMSDNYNERIQLLKNSISQS